IRCVPGGAGRTLRGARSDLRAGLERRIRAVPVAILVPDALSEPSRDGAGREPRFVPAPRRFHRRDRVPARVAMDRAEILAALHNLAASRAERGLAGDMFVVGGAAIAVAYDARRATRDIDAVFVPKREIYESAALVGNALGLPEDWLNDAVKGFLPASVAR